MKESVFQTKVIKYIESLPNTWTCVIWGGGFQRAGIPDVIACINGHFVAMELKTEIGRTSKLQDYNLEQIKKAQGFAVVLRPSNFDEFKKEIQVLYES